MYEEQNAAAVVTTWEGPGWAEWSRMDEQSVIYGRTIGAYADSEGTSVDVLLVQRDDIDQAGGMACVTRSPAYVSILGEHIPLGEAAPLAQLLLVSVDSVEQSHPRRAAAGDVTRVSGGSTAA